MLSYISVIVISIYLPDQVKPSTKLLTKGLMNRHHYISSLLQEINRVLLLVKYHKTTVSVRRKISRSKYQDYFTFYNITLVRPYYITSS